MTVRLFIQFSSNEQAGNVVNLKNCELGKAMGFLMTNFENVDQTQMDESCFFSSLHLKNPSPTIITSNQPLKFASQIAMLK